MWIEVAIRSAEELGLDFGDVAVAAVVARAVDERFRCFEARAGRIVLTAGEVEAREDPLQTRPSSRRPPAPAPPRPTQPPRPPRAIPPRPPDPLPAPSATPTATTARPTGHPPSRAASSSTPAETAHRPAVPDLTPVALDHGSYRRPNGPRRPRPDLLPPPANARSASCDLLKAVFSDLSPHRTAASGRMEKILKPPPPNGEKSQSAGSPRLLTTSSFFSAR
jgi:hypothetical protein